MTEDGEESAPIYRAPYFLSFFLFETCSISEKAIGGFYETSANVTICPTIGRWLLVFERLPHLEFFETNFCPLFLVPGVDMRSVSPPQHSAVCEAAASSPPGWRNCCRLSRHETGWTKDGKGWSWSTKCIPVVGNFIGEKQEEDDGGNGARIFPFDD